ncbi:MAG: cysteine--tRNA ligase, partial [Bacteroidota bacterium]
LFDAVRIINSVHDGKEYLSQNDISELKKSMRGFVFDVLGFVREESSGSNDTTEKLMKVILDLRNEAKLKKDFATSDKIRDGLKNAGVEVKDTKEGVEWKVEK